MNTTETRGPIRLPGKPQAVEAFRIPDLEAKLRRIHADLNAATGRHDQFSWSADWIDQAIQALRLQHQRKGSR